MHPDFGRYDSAHVPLFRLRSHWPKQFDVMSKLDTFAVARDPVERFCSALAQRIRQHHKQEPSDFSPRLVCREIDVVIAHLEQSALFPEYHFVHFCRQTDFTDLEGKRLVRHLYRVDDISRLVAELGRRLNENLLTDIRVNRTVTFRNRFIARPITFAKDQAKVILPFSVYSRLREFAMNFLTSDGADNIKSVVTRSVDIMRFIEVFYGKDFELFAEVSGRSPSLALLHSSRLFQKGPD
jgi:hypothetical protein